ncbi:hypothetical protein MJO28_002627 [Puccinia striiformis f. sp. tritici]|uniref:Uncharacterized protein n=1 Tax=Puccinia striiformis f. sp. tritici TaxID=168172 RepID=A0ACC0ES44_9BASI|nr:hypothetical protein MJO28_002627 [Puccinia striiformis f. sp. tritici]
MELNSPDASINITSLDLSALNISNATSSKKPKQTRDEKVKNMCELLHTPPNKVTPKEFIVHFLTSRDSQIASLRRLWAVDPGLNSTMSLVKNIRDEVTKTQIGREAWKEFIQQEAIEILSKQAPPKGHYPQGSFQSSANVKDAFFYAHEKETRDAILTSEHTLFLFNILMAMLQNQHGPITVVHDDEVIINNDIDPTEIPLDVNAVVYGKLLNGPEQLHKRFHRIVSTICSIMCFAANRRANSLQLTNSVRFLACGVTERVHEYMNYIALCSSRATAWETLKTLAVNAEKNTKKAKETTSSCPIAPTLCIDNLDIEQKVHDLSVGNRSHTYRGTWGYIHLPDLELVKTLDASELTLSAYQEAIRNLDSLEIEPKMFLPTAKEVASNVAVWKSQIARVLMNYLAEPADIAQATPTKPPPVEQIDHKKPELHMLKLMDASDNSAEGIGQVFHSLWLQSGLKAEEFFNRLQPMDGDLGTVQNFNCLRAQRTPNAYPQESLNNVVFQLGASHMLWNVASTIFTQHFGDPKVATDGGAWQFLEALGFPSEKAIQKKDFTLMINQMERVTESIIYYGLRVIMKTNCKPGTEERVKLPTAKWNAIVDECYSTFCTRQARKAAKALNCPRLYNTLLMLHDFSTVVEAKPSMKAGDIGRLLSVWKKWSLMAQALPGITNYSSYLPRQVLLLTVILPPSLRKYLRHNLLMSPTGRKDHFVAKDFWLEIQNYWLKFLYNRSGMGINIDQLRDVFSLNITMTMLQDLKTDCGSNIIRQSHKNVLSQRDFDMFTLMANNRDILDQESKYNGPVITPTEDFYLAGITKFQTHIRQVDSSVTKFKKHLTTNQQEGGEEKEAEDASVESCDM